MRKTLMVVAVAFTVLGLSMVGFAALQHPALGSRTGNGGSTLTCGPGETYAGEIAWLYPSTQNRMVAGPDGSKIFDLSQARLQGFPEANEFVTVNYTVVNGDRVASSVTAIPWQVARLYVGEY